MQIKTNYNLSKLNTFGINQVKEKAKDLASDFSNMYSSDLLRCIETAKILNEKLNLDIKYDKRLRERNFGEGLENKKWSDFTAEDLEIDRLQKYNYRPFGGESVDDVKERVLSFISDIKDEAKDKKTLVVTSAGVIRLLLSVYNDECPKTINNCGIYEFDIPDTIK
jgi:broad specificity phosphatase PhoE